VRGSRSSARQVKDSIAVPCHAQRRVEALHRFFLSKLGSAVVLVQIEQHPPGVRIRRTQIFLDEGLSIVEVPEDAISVRVFVTMQKRRGRMSL